ncbi:MAG TPA: metalloregulator ArsR/SmtB family transcription factor [Candidatus Acidoferrum sp.]|jgi:ArsR family transcriptional regulator
MKASHVNLMFRAFSDQTRLRILHLLLGGELCVCDIVTVIDVPQPTASRHLSYLLRAGLIQKRKEGLWAYYKLAPATSALQRNLFKCLEECFTELPELAADARRAKRENICCGVVDAAK